MFYPFVFYPFVFYPSLYRGLLTAPERRTAMNISLPVAAPRLFAGVGLLALLGAVGLVSMRPARSTGGPVPVAVTNTPLAVVSTDPAIAQPYAQTVFPNFAVGKKFAPNISLAVPVGKRLVVQTVSVLRTGTITPGSVSEIAVVVGTNGDTSYFALPSPPATAASFSGISQALTFQVDGGTSLTIFGSRNTTVGSEGDIVTVSGYLVNVP